MIELKNAIDEWMKGWDECQYCNHMLKVELLSSDNEDKLICNDCVEDDIMLHWIS